MFRPVATQLTADGLTDRRILFFLTDQSGRQAPFQASDGGQNADGLTDRRILFFLNYQSGRRAPFRGFEPATADRRGQVDGQTNSVLFD